MGALEQLPAVRAALARSLELLKILDVEHTVPELHRAADAVRWELATTAEALGEAAPVQPVPLDPPARPQDLERAARTRPQSGRHLVLLALGEDDRTDHELIRALADRMMPASVHARRWELRAAGWVQPLVEVAVPMPVPTRRDGQIVWTLTASGIQALVKLDAGQMVLALLGDGMPEVS